MTTYQNQNEAGEWLIDGAALRFEAALDEQDAWERQAYDEDFYADYDEPECDDDHECDSCDGPGGIWSKKGAFTARVFTAHPGQVWHCTYCDRPCPEGAHD